MKVSLVKKFDFGNFDRSSNSSKLINHLVKLIDKILLRKHAVIESVNDHLKNICQIEHFRHRSPFNFLVNLMAGLAAYTISPKI